LKGPGWEIHRAPYALWLGLNPLESHFLCAEKGSELPDRFLMAKRQREVAANGARIGAEFQTIDGAGHLLGSKCLIAVATP